MNIEEQQMAHPPRRPIVAIVGRPNVGKSTLFNRLLREKKAAVHPKPGMTRDRHYSDAEYRMRQFILIDTGGYEASTDSTLLQQMRMQSLLAIEEADAVVFLTNVHEPEDQSDFEIIEKLRASGKPFFLAVNKCDSVKLENQAYGDFSRYGLDRIYPVSALHGDGLYDMFDDITEEFPEWDPDKVELTAQIPVAIVGRQNAGKSTLVNQLLGQERVIANPLAGTTRDAIDAAIKVDEQEYLLIDTAGIRRRGKIERGPEKLSVHSSFQAIDRAEVCLLVIDCDEGITAQDQHIAGYVLERRRACIILLNKWDLVPDKESRYGEILKNVRREFNFMPWAPIMTISAMTGQRTHKIWELIQRCSANFRKEFTTSYLNEVLSQAKAYLSPPTHKGNSVNINYVTQTGIGPPRFTLFANNPEYIHFSYRRFLTNQLYRHLGMEGTPIVLRYKKKSAPRGWERKPGKKKKIDSTEVFDDQSYFAGAYSQEGEDIGAGLDYDTDFEWESELNEEDDL